MRSPHVSIAACRGATMLRRAIRGGLGVTAAALVSDVSRRALAGDAALFGGARHQFTLLRPVRTVPPVSLMRVNGSAIDFASLRGKVVLVNFWATWCPACRSELPALERLQIAMGGAGFEVVAISVDRDGAAASHTPSSAGSIFAACRSISTRAGEPGAGMATPMRRSRCTGCRYRIWSIPRGVSRGIWQVRPTGRPRKPGR